MTIHNKYFTRDKTYSFILSYFRVNEKETELVITHDHKFNSVCWLCAFRRANRDYIPLPPRNRKEKWLPWLRDSLDVHHWCHQSKTSEHKITYPSRRRNLLIQEALECESKL